MATPPPLPADAEQQAAQERSAAEQAAMALFAVGAIEAAQGGGGDISDTDLHILRRMTERLVKAIAWNVFTGARIPAREADVQRMSEEILGPPSAPSKVSQGYAKVVLALRARAAGTVQEPGTLSPQRAAARDFATHVYNSVAAEVAAKLPVPDFAKSWVLKKTWVSQADSRVRDLHRMLHGRTRRYDQDFFRWPITGQRLRYPGDWEAPVDATINCRCVMLLSFATPDLSKLPFPAEV